jgi:translation initiation factor 1A
MPKSTGGTSHRRQKKHRNSDEHHHDVPVKSEGQEYAQIVKNLGGHRMTGACFDGQSRLCHVRGALQRGYHNRISEGDIVLIGLRDYQDSKADILYKYTAEEVRKLKSVGELPSNTNVNATDGEQLMNPTDIGVDFEFDFETI